MTQDMGIGIDTLRSLLKILRMQVEHVSRHNQEQQRIGKLEAEIRAICKQLSEKDEAIDILKNHQYSVEAVMGKYRCFRALQR